jgi:hypothetical protein
MQPETIINCILQEHEMWLTLDDIARLKELLLSQPPQTVEAIKLIFHRQERDVGLREIKIAVDAINKALAE